MYNCYVHRLLVYTLVRIYNSHTQQTIVWYVSWICYIQIQVHLSLIVFFWRLAKINSVDNSVETDIDQ